MQREPIFLRTIGMALCALLVSGASGQRALAQSATRDLSGYAGLEVTFTVTITIETPGGTTAVGLEEAPPAGWIVSNISDGGAWDVGQEEVKWGPFFGGGTPAFVTYDVTPPASAGGDECFAGTVSFDALNLSVGGEQCIAVPIPAASTWGLAVMAIMICTLATLLLILRDARRV